LSSGIPCIQHRCNLCCIKTEMPLTRSDINRILRLGYKLEDFAVKVEGEWRLRNINGKCYAHTPMNSRVQVRTSIG